MSCLSSLGMYSKGRESDLSPSPASRIHFQQARNRVSFFRAAETVSASEKKASDILEYRGEKPVQYSFHIKRSGRQPIDVDFSACRHI